MCRDSLQIPTDQAASILVSLITNTAIFGPETFQTFFFFKLATEFYLTPGQRANPQASSTLSKHGADQRFTRWQQHF